MQGAAAQFPSSPGLAAPLLLATTGLAWPAALAAAGQVQRLDAETVERCSRSDGPPLWLGYANPLQLLTNPNLRDPIDALERWCQEARWLLSIRQACPERCQLLNLPLLTPAAIAALASEKQASARPAQPAIPQEPRVPGPMDPHPSDIDPRLLVLALQHPSLQPLYADLEGCAALHGREPSFQLGLPALRSEAFASRCLESWRQQAETRLTVEELRTAAEQAAAERNEAREEAELTLLQLHQVQEELEQIFLQHREVSAERDQLQTSGEQLRQEAEQLRAAKAQASQERDDAREEAELTLLQLHQVQEELEHYFLEHRKASQELSQLRHELEELQQEARLLFVHSSPKPGLNRTHLSRIAQLMRESLELLPS